MSKTNTYEAMFLVDAGQASFETACEPIRKVLQRGEAEVLAVKNWDERRLCYEIRGRKRGQYVLTYFKLDPARIAELENDCRLEEGILRVLILRKDEVTEEELNAQTPATGKPEEEDHRSRRRSRDDEDRPEGRRRRRDEEKGDADKSSGDSGDSDEDDDSDNGGDENGKNDDRDDED